MSLSAPSKPRLGEEEWLMKRPASRGFTSVRIGAFGRGIISQDGNQKAAPTMSQLPLFSLAKKVAWTLEKSDILTLLTATAIEFPNLIFYSLNEPCKGQTFLHFLQQQLLNFQTLFSIASLNLEKVRHSYTSYSNSYWISKPYFL